ncbi:MAG: undecaprenyl-phosphate glucose phosphotransferase [Methylotenera sp.]|nr:undecaprenyl-phosphate glucose phosphotransferase [Methylotenera sp.]
MFTESSRKKPRIGRHSKVSSVLQALMDGAAVVFIALGLIGWNIGDLDYQYTVLLLALLGTLAVVYDRLAIYRSNSSFTFKVIDLAKGWSITFLVVILLGFLTKTGENYSRILLAELYVLGFVAQIALHLFVRMVQKKLLANKDHVEKVIIVGQGVLANYLNNRINNNPWMGQHVVGSVSLTSDWISQDSAALDENSPRNLGDVSNLVALIGRHNISTVYIVTSLELSKMLEPIYFSLLDKNVAVHWVPDIFSLRLINHSIKEIAGVPVLTLSETPLIGTSLLAKNIEDFTLSGMLILLLSPLLLLIALLIKLDSPGPVFFKQKRTGWNGKVFEIFKFRSMHIHQESHGEVKQAQKGDPRITRVGKFIRKTSLDELPQLFNVFLGTMSLVGPRPHATQHDDEYSKKITNYFARHNIKPGITGLAQVRGHRGETIEIGQMMLRVESDIEYINNWSIWLDFLILLRTFSALSGKNAY